MNEQRQKTLNAAFLYHACLPLLQEALDDLQGTKLYSQRTKNLTNTLGREIEKQLAGFFKLLGDETTEKEYYEAVGMVEQVIEALKATKPDNYQAFKQLLEDWNNGEINVVDDKAIAYSQAVMPDAVKKIGAK